jgi:hypothetical protein
MKKHSTQINLDVAITYEILEPIEAAGYILPPMIELQSAYVELEKEDGRKATVNILKVLSESQRMLIEDEIIDALTGEDE